MSEDLLNPIMCHCCERIYVLKCRHPEDGLERNQIEVVYSYHRRDIKQAEIKDESKPRSTPKKHRFTNSQFDNSIIE